MLRQTQPDTPTNRTYAGSENAFINFVADQPIDILARWNVEQPSRYVTQKSIEHYYLTDQSFKCNAKGTMNRVVNALNALAVREGSNNSDLYFEDPQKPDIRNSTAGTDVNSVLKLVANKKEAKMRRRAEEDDPHKDNLLNIINQEEISRIMMTQHKDGVKWADSASIWAITTLVLLRFDSACLLCLNNMFLC